MDYIKTDNIEHATHWIPIYDELFIGTYHTRWIVSTYRKIVTKFYGKEFKGNKMFTYGKPYKLQIDSKDEYYFIDDMGNENYLWNAHKGYFIKEL